MTTKRTRNIYEKDPEYVDQPVANPDENLTFLDQNAKTIWEMEAKGTKASVIAKFLVAQHKLRQGAITAKQVSNWIGYRKRSGQNKTRSVSLKNNNLDADRDHNRNCMILFSLLYFYD